MTISKRLQLKLFVLFYSTFVVAPVVPLMATSVGPMVVAAKKRIEYNQELKDVQTSGQQTLVVASPRAAVCSEKAATVPSVVFMPEMVKNSTTVCALVEGARYWDGEQRRMAM
jgi:hypothetical protein